MAVCVGAFLSQWSAAGALTGGESGGEADTVKVITSLSWRFSAVQCPAGESDDDALGTRAITLTVKS